MSCHRHNQKKINSDKHKVTFSNNHRGFEIPPSKWNLAGNNLKSAHSSCKKHVEKLSNGRTESGNYKNSSTRCSNYFNHTQKGSNSASTPCVLHCKNGMPAAVNTNSLPKEFRHSCKMCPGDFSHTTCKYCLDDTFEDKVPPTTSEHTNNHKQSSCKYCDHGKEEQQSFCNDKDCPTDFSHSSCKYCDDNGQDEAAPNNSPITSSNDSLDAYPDELKTSDSCFLHGQQRRISSLKDLYGWARKPCHSRDSHKRTHFHGRRCTYCENPSICLANDYEDDIRSRFKEHPYNKYTPVVPRLDLRNDFSDAESLMYDNLRRIRLKENISLVAESVLFRPCEFCIRNGETAVIYNSHQLRNKSGDITCPILKQEICSTCDVTSDFGYCPKNTYRKFLAASHLNCDSATCCPESLLEAPCYDVCCDFNEEIPFVERLTHNGRYTSDINTSSYKSGVRTSKRNIPCQFCLANGELPHIYNSHRLRDETGITCPILKQHLENHSSVEAIRACRHCANASVIDEPHIQLLKRFSNGSLNKRQYLDLINCLT